MVGGHGRGVVGCVVVVMTVGVVVLVVKSLSVDAVPGKLVFLACYCKCVNGGERQFKAIKCHLSKMDRFFYLEYIGLYPANRILSFSGSSANLEHILPEPIRSAHICNERGFVNFDRRAT